MRLKTIAVLILLSLACMLKGQDTINVMHYNILRYGLDCNVDIATKTTWLGNIFTHAKPDILTVNEIGNNEAYANRIKLQALTYAPMEYAPNSNQNGSFIVNRLFYNTDKFDFVRLQNISGSLRDIDVVTLRHKPRAMAGDTLEFDCINMHLKAGSTQSDRNQRQTAAISIMAWIKAQGPDYKNYLVMGDFNVGGAGEDAWQNMTFNSDPDINLIDPTGYRNGWGSNTAHILTQAPTDSRSDCGVGGGLDDRFDFILVSKAISSHTDQIGFVPDSYEALGNDGRVYNQEINCTNNGSVPSNICGNLKQASDHLPVVMQLKLGYPTGISEAEWPGAKLQLKQFADKRNPELHLRHNDLRSVFSVAVFDAQGHELFADFLQNNHVILPMANKPPGMYVVKVQNAKGQQKVVKFLW